MNNTSPETTVEEGYLMISYVTMNAGARPLMTASTALKHHRDSFMALLGQMIALAEDELLRAKVEKLKQESQQLELWPSEND